MIHAVEETYKTPGSQPWGLLCLVGQVSLTDMEAETRAFQGCKLQELQELGVDKGSWWPRLAKTLSPSTGFPDRRDKGEALVPTMPWVLSGLELPTSKPTLPIQVQ